MSEEVGPGAGRTAQPGVEVVTERIAALDRHLTHEIAALRRETAAANETAARAIEVAAQEAKDRLAAHNGLIAQNRDREEQNRQAQEKAAATFATRDVVDKLEEHLSDKLSRVEKFQAMLTGGIILLGFLGAANLVKAFGG